jgi:hypothetical protein
MAGSLSVASTAVSLAKVAVVASGEVGRSAGIIMALGHCIRVCGEFCVLNFSLYKEVSAMQIGF